MRDSGPRRARARPGSTASPTAASARPVEVTVVNRQRSFPVDRVDLESFVLRLTREIAPGACDRMAVALVSDARMRALNRDFAGRDRTTDVLSFPGGDEPLPEGGRHLGDVVVSVPRAAEQARAAGHDLDREIKILVVHGYLHLLGHDHETDDGTMLRLQSRLVRKLLLAPPRTTT